MAYTLGEASKACGKSKPAILDAIRKNKLSATRDAFNRWQIDPAELFRVYPKPLPGQNVTDQQPPPDYAAENRLLKATIEGLERLCSQIEGERDSLREQNTRLTAILTDQSTRLAEQAPVRRSWFSWRKKREKAA